MVSFQVEAKAMLVLRQVQAVQECNRNVTLQLRAQQQSAPLADELSSTEDEDGSSDDQETPSTTANGKSVEERDQTSRRRQSKRRAPSESELVRTLRRDAEDSKRTAILIKENARLKLTKLLMENVYLEKMLDDAKAENEKNLLRIASLERKLEALGEADNQNSNVRDLRQKEITMEKHVNSLMMMRNKSADENLILKKIVLTSCEECRQRLPMKKKPKVVAENNNNNVAEADSSPSSTRRPTFQMAAQQMVQNLGDPKKAGEALSSPRKVVAATSAASSSKSAAGAQVKSKSASSSKQQQVKHLPPPPSTAPTRSILKTKPKFSGSSSTLDSSESTGSLTNSGSSLIYLNSQLSQPENSFSSIDASHSNARKESTTGTENAPVSPNRRNKSLEKGGKSSSRKLSPARQGRSRKDEESSVVKSPGATQRSPRPVVERISVAAVLMGDSPKSIKASIKKNRRSSVSVASVSSSRAERIRSANQARSSMSSSCSELDTTDSDRKNHAKQSADRSVKAERTRSAKQSAHEKTTRSASARDLDDASVASTRSERGPEAPKSPSRSSQVVTRVKGIFGKKEVALDAVKAKGGLQCDEDGIPDDDPYFAHV